MPARSMRSLMTWRQAPSITPGRGSRTAGVSVIPRKANMAFSFIVCEDDLTDGQNLLAELVLPHDPLNIRPREEELPPGRDGPLASGREGAPSCFAHDRLLGTLLRG
jgi:hypothetical protein